MTATPLQVALSASQPIVAEPWQSSTRSKCLRLIESIHGKDSVPHFLQTFQEDFGATGCEMLQSKPDLLLGALRARKRRIEGRADIDAILQNLAEGIEP